MRQSLRANHCWGPPPTAAPRLRAPAACYDATRHRPTLELPVSTDMLTVESRAPSMLTVSGAYSSPAAESLTSKDCKRQRLIASAELHAEQWIAACASHTYSHMIKGDADLADVDIHSVLAATPVLDCTAMYL